MVKIRPSEKAKHKLNRYLVFGVNGWKSKGIKEITAINDTKTYNNIGVRNLDITFSIQLG